MTAPTIAVINTGGTLSCTGDPLAPMTAAQFGDAARRLLDPVVPQSSPGLTLTYVTDLAFPESASHTLTARTCSRPIGA